LIAASDDALASELGALLVDLGVNVRRARSESATFSQLDELVFDVLIVEHSLSENLGVLLATLLERAPELSVIVLVGPKELSIGVAAVRLGATDFLRTPLERDEVVYVVQ
jgi:FixJ family two-component response regulator